MSNESERQVFIVRRYNGISDSWTPQRGDFDQGIEKAVDVVSDGKASSAGVEVVEVQILRAVHVKPEIARVTVTPAASTEGPGQ